MSDLIREIQGGIGAGVVTDIRQKYVDVGGDHAIAVAVVSGGGGGGGGGGDASAANQLTQISRLEDIANRLPDTAHSQPLTAAELRASPVPVADAPALAKLQAISAALPATLEGGRLPVALAEGSDQSALAVLSPADHLLPAAWDLTGVQSTDIVHVEDNRNQRVIALTLDPTSATPVSEMRSLAAVDSPCEISAHLSMSQRVRMDACALALVDRTTLTPVPGPWTISSISQSGTTCTITLTTPFVGPLGTPIDITGTPDNRLHYQLAPVASISEDRLTLTVTFTDGAAIPSGTFSPVAGGTLAYSPDPLGLTATGAGYAFNSSTTTSATLLARSGGATRLASSVSSLTTDPRSSTASTRASQRAGALGTPRAHPRST